MFFLLARCFVLALVTNGHMIQHAHDGRQATFWGIQNKKKACLTSADCFVWDAAHSIAV